MFQEKANISTILICSVYYCHKNAPQNGGQ